MEHSHIYNEWLSASCNVSGSQCDFHYFRLCRMLVIIVTLLIIK